jgi:hypothetical protein
MKQNRYAMQNGYLYVEYYINGYHVFQKKWLGREESWWNPKSLYVYISIWRAVWLVNNLVSLESKGFLRRYIHSELLGLWTLSTAQWLRIALSEGPNRVGISFPISKDWKRSSFRKVLIYSYLEFWMMGNVCRPSHWGIFTSRLKGFSLDNRSGVWLSWISTYLSNTRTTHSLRQYSWSIP